MTNTHPTTAPLQPEDEAPMTRQELQAEIEKISGLLAKLGEASDEALARQNINRQEVEQQYRDYLQALENELMDLDRLVQEAPAAVAVPMRREEAPASVSQKKSVTPVSDPVRGKVTSILTGDHREQVTTERKNMFVKVGSTPLFIAEQPRDRSTWQALPSAPNPSSGMSTVKFLKRNRQGVEIEAVPGELKAFSEAHKHETLETIYNLLHDRNELEAYKDISTQLETLQVEYNTLDRDQPAEKQRKAEILEESMAFLTSEGVQKLKFKKKEKIKDLEDFCERVADIIRIQAHLREIDETGNYFIPKLDPNYEMSPYFSEKFDELSRLIHAQLGLTPEYLDECIKQNKEPEWEKLRPSGMTCVVGPAGSGKNKILEHFCAVTNRPMYRYSCAPNQDEGDLTYNIRLKNAETREEPSRIITAITEPNAVLILDEFNLWDPAVAKLMNAPLDADRALYLPDRVIKIAPGVIIVGLMNPASYEGVNNAPDTLRSRTNAMMMDYAPLSKDDYKSFTFDEALILKSFIAPLRKLSKEGTPDAERKMFTRLWNQIINGRSEGLSPDATVIRVMKDLKNMLLICDKTRAAKRKKGEEKMDTPIDTRTLIQAAQYYSNYKLWEKDLNGMPNYQKGWNAAQYAMASAYLGKTHMYKKGPRDEENFTMILTETLKAAA